MPKTHATSLRLSTEAHDIVASLAKRWGITRADVIEMAVRHLRDTLDSIHAHPIYADEESLRRTLRAPASREEAEHSA
jgi:hypothetical protein